MKKTILCVVFFSNATLANDSTMDDLFAMDLSSLLTVQIATGTAIELKKAPAVATVITAAHIKQMRARNLTQVLNTVPGLKVSSNADAVGLVFGFRGIVSRYGPHALVMVNGVSLKSVMRGDNHAVWGEFPVHAIARIEVIRGPGSALYGADAFSGVINIITKSHQNIEYSEVGASAGSFNSYNVWSNHNLKMSDWKVALNVEYSVSDGYDGQVDRDAQTVFDETGDNLFTAGILPVDPIDASLAPGNLSKSFKALDIWLSGENPYLKINLGVQDRSNVGLGYGTIEALDPHGRLGSYKHILQTQLKPINFTHDLNIEAEFQLNQSGQTVEEYLHLLPAGALFGAFTQPLIGNPEWDESYLKFEVKSTYSGWDNHEWVLGAGYNHQDLYEVRESKNFNSDFSPNPLGVVDVSDTPEVFIPEEKRENNYLFLQDVFQISQNWMLTAGLRYDDYTDFGSTLNPRMALVWSTSSKLTTKLLLGRAFRAPAFAETIIVNNPAALGNPNLVPEVIESYELAFNYIASDVMELDFNIFRYNISDFVTFAADAGSTTLTAQNDGGRTGLGLESAMHYRASDNWLITANYSFVKAEDKLTEHDVGAYPSHMAYIRANWFSNSNWQGHGQLHYVGERKRAYGDIRSSVASYMSVDLGLTYEFDNINTDVELLANNVFNVDVREPSLGTFDMGLTPVNIPYDIPQAGRSVYLSFTKYF